MAADELRRRVLEQLAQRRSLTQNAVADRAGVVPATLHRFLNDESRGIDPATCRKLADFFDWPVVEVFRWAELLPASEAADPVAKLHEALYEGAWPEDLAAAIYRVAQATVTRHNTAPGVIPLEAALVQRILAESRAAIRDVASESGEPFDADEILDLYEAVLRRKLAGE